MELLIAKNPDPDSSLPYLLRIPLASAPLLRVRDVWPRTNAVYCHPVDDSEWPADPEIVERIDLRVCERRGHRHRRQPQSREPLTDRLHYRPRSQDGLLAVAPHA